MKAVVLATTACDEDAGVALHSSVCHQSRARFCNTGRISAIQGPAGAVSHEECEWRRCGGRRFLAQCAELERRIPLDCL